MQQVVRAPFTTKDIFIAQYANERSACSAWPCHVAELGDRHVIGRQLDSQAHHLDGAAALRLESA